MQYPAMTVWLGMSSIGCLTLFFSGRRRLCIRIFVPSEDLRKVLGALPRDPDFGRMMRLMGCLQLVFAAAMGIVVHWLKS
jgi:hypothetical protein